MDILDKIEKGSIFLDRKKVIDAIIQDCFWDYFMTADDIENIVKSDNFEVKKKLFLKILLHSRDAALSLLIFKKSDLIALFDNLEISKKYRINTLFMILRNIYFNEKNIIRVLVWKKI